MDDFLNNIIEFHFSDSGQACVQEYCSDLTSKPEYWACVAEHCRLGLLKKWTERAHSVAEIDQQQGHKKLAAPFHGDKKWIKDKLRTSDESVHENDVSDDSKRWVDSLHQGRSWPPKYFDRDEDRNQAAADGVISVNGRVKKRWIDSTHMRDEEGRRSMHDSMEMCIRRLCQGMGGEELRQCAVICSQTNPTKRSKVRSTGRFEEGDEEDEEIKEEEEYEGVKRWIDQLNYSMNENKWNVNQNKKSREGSTTTLAACLMRHCAHLQDEHFSTCVGQVCADFLPWVRADALYKKGIQLQIL